MKLVIKIGGRAIDEPRQRREVARQVAQLRRSGHKLAIVHGGGQLLTRTLERMGIATEFDQGLRITDASTRDVALMVLAGIVNKQWVTEIESQGQRALGICGGDASLVEARKLTLRRNGHSRDLGFVGEPRKINPRILELAFRQGIVPVVASLAPDSRGEYLNINADDLASAIAAALQADRLLYLTESGGVWDADRQLLPVVKAKEIPSLIQKGIVRDGMIPKLRSCARTLARNVEEVDIISPAMPRGLLRVLKSREQVGTRIVKS